MPVHACHAVVNHFFRDRSQPFYHLLVEVSDWSYDAAQPPVAYVAQELLAAPELEDEGASWGQVWRL
jgi:hemimethylated DNA binding protein